MEKGKDYVANVILVQLKTGISSADLEKIKKKMSAIGETKVHSFTAINLTIYTIKIKNGMSEKEACKALDMDPAVKHASVDGTMHGIK